MGSHRLIQRAEALLAESCVMEGSSANHIAMRGASECKPVLETESGQCTQDLLDPVVFFTSQRATGSQMCADCDASSADWASVSHGIYLCTECAGRHRGLGVHLSFVRSTTMDRWSQCQLRQMQLGGRERFHDFLAGYPGLRDFTLTDEDLRCRYSSRAAAFYRRTLHAMSNGLSNGEAEDAPPAEAGHLEATLQCFLANRGDDEKEACEADDAENENATLEEERAAFEAAFLEYERKTQPPTIGVVSPSSLTSSAGRLDNAWTSKSR